MMEFVNGKDDIPYMKWKIKAMFETTNQKISSIWKTTIFSDLTRHTVMTPHCQKLHLVATFLDIRTRSKSPSASQFSDFRKRTQNDPSNKTGDSQFSGPSLTINIPQRWKSSWPSVNPGLAMALPCFLSPHDWSMIWSIWVCLKSHDLPNPLVMILMVYNVPYSCCYFGSIHSGNQT